MYSYSTNTFLYRWTYWLNHRFVYICIVFCLFCVGTSIEVQIDQSEITIYYILCLTSRFNNNSNKKLASININSDDNNGNSNSNSISEPFSIALNSQFTLTDIVQHYLSMSFLRQTQLFSAPYIQYDLVLTAVRTREIIRETIC